MKADGSGVRAMMDDSKVRKNFADDESHGISKLKNRLDLYPLVADFLDRYMK